MLKFVTIVGARPQIIKAAAINRTFRQQHAGKVQELIVHTGQHYDHNMSQVFFDELQIDTPAYNLEIGSAQHGKQTGEMMMAIEPILEKEKPDAVIVYGDTNSTLAGALTASKLNIPVVHIEAGLRSFNKAMPEEVNRILTDNVSTLLFTPTSTGYQNLVNEGFKETASTDKPDADNPGLYHCGDIMYDNSLYFAEVAARNTNMLAKLGVENTPFALATIHRNNNTDIPLRLGHIFRALITVADVHKLKMIIPLHPRTQKVLQDNLGQELYEQVICHPLLRITQPASFLEMSLLESAASLVITDSGGVQKEAYFFKKPGIVLRNETEWVELLQSGTSLLADANEQRIVEAAAIHMSNMNRHFPPIFGNGKAAEFICQKMVDVFTRLEK